MRAALSAPPRPLADLRAIADVPRPDLTDVSGSASEAWDEMVAGIMLGCAGLIRYLIDSYPDDLPEYDPL